MGPSLNVSRSETTPEPSALHADVLICSHPRSGGRWLRFLLAHYLSSRHDLPVPRSTQEVFPLVPDHHDESTRGYPAFQYRDAAFPMVAVCHQPYTWDLHQAYPIAFLARNAYDVAVSGYSHLGEQKGTYSGSMRDFIRHPTLGIPAWIRYVNSWAPRLLRHRDNILIPYGQLSRNTRQVLERLVGFLDEPIVEEDIDAAVRTASKLRSERKIRTGQEGNFWDNLEPQEIFDIQAMLEQGLSELAVALLQRTGVDVDPFPRGDDA